MKYYVYIYRDPRDNKPFYIGKGHGNRYKSHLKEAKTKKTSHKLNTIRSIISDGFQPTVEFIIQNISEKDALKLEIAYIKLFGRRDIQSGILTNNTDGGEGHVGWSPEMRAMMSDFHKNYISAKDIDGNHFKISKDDPRWISGELVGQNKGIVGTNINGKLSGYILAKDIDGNHFRVKKDDPRWVSGELVGINKNKVAHENTKKAARERKGFKRSAESIELGSSKIRGIQKSEEHRLKLSESIKNLPKTKCPNCDRLLNISGMARHLKAAKC